MAIAIRLPGLGESISEGEIVSWQKQVGDRVDRDDALCTVSTDKVETEVPSLEEGTLLAIVAKPGQTIEVGAILCVLGAEGEAVPPELLVAEEAPARAPTRTRPAPAPRTRAVGPRDAASRTRQFRASGDRKLFVSPVVRRLAREHDVDLSAVSGTGDGGRVSRRDLEAFIAGGGGGSGFAAPPGGYAPGQRIPFGGFARRVVAPFDPTTAERYQPQTGDGDVVEALSGMGRAMAEHMAYTWWRAPHVSTLVEVDLDRLARWRGEHKVAFAQEHGAKLSYTACISWVLARVLGSHPSFNSSITHDHQRITHGRVNLGVAVAKPDDGLVVPVIRDAGSMGLVEFAKALQAQVDAAKAGRIRAADLSGGTFTITNVGSNGNLASMPLINQPQVAILATGAVKKRVVVVTDEAGHDTMAIRPMMFLTLTYDHRANDGARSGRFLRSLRKALEQWSGELD